MGGAGDLTLQGHKRTNLAKYGESWRKIELPSFPREFWSMMDGSYPEFPDNCHLPSNAVLLVQFMAPFYRRRQNGHLGEKYQF
jgi:hypothetical protein